MRTTVDLPDSVFRETKALAAMRGITMKQFILEAIEQAKNVPPPAPKPGKLRKFPSFHLRSGRKLSLRNFDFDDLLT
jgi:hypothetical protein